MKINYVNNSDYKYKSKSFGALKNIREMDWDRKLAERFYLKASDIFQLNNNNLAKNPKREYFLRNLYLYWQNAVDQMIGNFVRPSVEDTKKSETIDKYLDCWLDTTNRMTWGQKNLIKKVSNFPNVAEDSYIQDSILEMVVKRKKMNKNTMQVLDIVLSNKAFSENPDNLRRMWRYLSEYQNKESVQFLKFVAERPELYFNDSFYKSMESILSVGENLPEGLCLLEQYTRTPSLCKNENINKNIGEIIYQRTVRDNVDSHIVLDMYSKDNNLQNNTWVNGHIGSLSACINRNNSDFIYNLLNTPDLYTNENYTDRFMHILNLIEEADPLNACIYTEILKKINSSPHLYLNKGIITDVENIFRCPKGIEEANAKLAIMDKYISNQKYYNNVHLQFSISEFVRAVTSYNLNFIKEILNDSAIKTPKRTYFENYDILRASSGRCFENMEDYDLYQQVKNDSVNHIEKLSTHIKTLDPNLLELFFNSSPAPSYLLKLLGRKSFEEAYGLKFYGLEPFSNDLYLILKNTSDEFFEMIIQKTNLKQSRKYKLLNKKLKKLKGKYAYVSGKNDDIKLKAFQNKIYIISHKIREMEQKEIKDSQFKINLLRQISKMHYSDAGAIIKMVQKTGITNRQEWNEILLKNVLSGLDIQYNQNLVNKLGLRDKPYLDKILISTDNFKKNLQDIFMMLMFYPQKSVEEIFNDLPQNKTTKKMFNDIGADYDKWVKYDKNSKIELCDTDGKQFTFKKVNMNDIMYSLFLGNYASCCMKAGGGSFSDTAPNYIKNKFISAIEVLDGDKPVGNTICYLALANGKPVLILDNVKVLPEYDNEEFMRKGFLSYAKKLCEEIGLKDIPVLTSSTRQSVKISRGPYMRSNDFVIVGSSGSDYVYIDDITESEIISPNKTYDKDLYDFENIVPDDSDGIDPVMYGINTIMPRNIYIYYENPHNIDELNWRQ